MTTVEKIHLDFDTATDRLLNEARALINPKSDRLLALGFKSSKDVVGVPEARELAALILDYKVRYPFHKFITESELERICNKWGLVYSSVGNYTGTVPEKNLREIENAPKLSYEDAIITGANSLGRIGKTTIQFHEDMFYNSGAFLTERRAKELGVPSVLPYMTNITTRHEFEKHLEVKYPQISPYYHKVNTFSVVETKSVAGLFIAAPLTDFNLKGLKKTNNGFFREMLVRKVIEDPIVFRYIRGGVQILSKWGPEAVDESLTNEIEN